MARPQRQASHAQIEIPLYDNYAHGKSVGIFIKVFAEFFSKSDYSLFYLLASSIATATGAVILSLRVVTSAR